MCVNDSGNPRPVYTYTYTTVVAFDALLEVLTEVESRQTEGCCTDDGDMVSGINREVSFRKLLL